MSETTTPAAPRAPQHSLADQLLLVALFAIGILGLALSYADGMSKGHAHAYLLDDQLILNGEQSFRTVAPNVPATLTTTLTWKR